RCAAPPLRTGPALLGSRPGPAPAGPVCFAGLPRSAPFGGCFFVPAPPWGSIQRGGGGPLIGRREVGVKGEGHPRKCPFPLRPFGYFSGEGKVPGGVWGRAAPKRPRRGAEKAPLLLSGPQVVPLD